MVSDVKDWIGCIIFDFGFGIVFPSEVGLLRVDRLRLERPYWEAGFKFYFIIFITFCHYYYYYFTFASGSLTWFLVQFAVKGLGTLGYGFIEHELGVF